MDEFLSYENSVTSKQDNLLQRFCIYNVITKKQYNAIKTKQQAWEVINKNMEKYKKRRYEVNAAWYAQVRRERADRRRGQTSENPFCGPYGCDYVDCYDFGIFPWGDS